MTQLSNDCFKHSKKRISLEKAVSILEKRIKCIKKTEIHIFLKTPLGATIITEKEEEEYSNDNIHLIIIICNYSHSVVAHPETLTTIDLYSV